MEATFIIFVKLVAIAISMKWSLDAYKHVSKSLAKAKQAVLIERGRFPTDFELIVGGLLILIPFLVVANIPVIFVFWML